MAKKGNLAQPTKPASAMPAENPHGTPPTQGVGSTNAHNDNLQAMDEDKASNTATKPREINIPATRKAAAAAPPSNARRVVFLKGDVQIETVDEDSGDSGSE